MHMPLTLAACVFFLGIVLFSLAEERTLLRPTALFGMMWFFIIASASVIPFGTHMLRPEAIEVFVVGGCAFVLASKLADAAFATTSDLAITPNVKGIVQVVAAVYNLALLALIPFFVAELLRAMDVLQLDNFAIAARIALGPEREQLQVPHFYQSMTSVGSILALACASTYAGRTRDKIALGLSIPGPLALAVLTFSRSPVVSLLVGICMVLAVRGQISRWSSLVLLAGGLIVAVAMGLLLNKGPDPDIYDSPLQGLAHNIGLYLGGGALGFSAVMDQPFRVTEPGQAYTFFTQLLHWIGLVDTLPDPIMGDISSDLGNVYTYYLAYWADGGWFGIVAIAATTGFVGTSLYRLARRGSLLASVGYGMAAYGVLLEGTNDTLFASSVPWILMLFGVGGPQVLGELLTRRPVVAHFPERRLVDP